jgi:hypothetical protein
MRTIYPRVMRWETAGPPGAGDAHSSQPVSGEETREAAGDEHLGPLSFTREVKDDGRALILYRRRGERGDG